MKFPVVVYISIILSGFCVGCTPGFSGKQVATVLSPDGLVEATLSETNGGATTSFGYDISLRSKAAQNSERVAYLYGAIRNDTAYGANLVWSARDTLSIQYLRAKSAVLVKSEANLGGHEIHVKLQGGVEDPTAPPGGMEYNLRNHASR